MSNEELVARIQAGIDTGENMLQLWQQNRNFIYFIASQYQGSAELDDLQQEGYLALYDAVDGFKQEYGFTFLTYAKQWIRQRMMRYIQNNGTVRIPVYEGEMLRKYSKMVNSYHVHFGRKPTRGEIAQSMGISVKMVIDLEKAARISKLGSLDSYLSEEEDGNTVGDMIADDVDIEADVLEDVQHEQLKTVIWSMVDELPDQQGEVIRQRFQDDKTLKATSESLGVTIERVRQIEDKAMRGLRCSRNSRLLRSFLVDEKAYSMGITGNGVTRFNTTGTSSTERAALKLYEELMRY